jgi:cellulose synthase operon protein C
MKIPVRASGLWLIMCLAALRAFGAPAAQPADCAAAERHGQHAQAQSCFEALAHSADPYFRAEGDWGLERYDAANQEFRSAVSRDGRRALYRVRWGRLLHERFNDTDAAALFHEALKRDPDNAPAYLGLALLSAAGFDEHALDYVHKALQIDPRSVEAHELLADLLLEDSDVPGASDEADAALRIDPSALKAMSLEAAMALLADRPAESWVQRFIQIDPNYGQGYALMARHLVLNRRYEEGVAYYRKAIEVDPKGWAARSELAINLMRVGKMQEAQQQLQTCYNAGFRNAATVNSLRLLDTYKGFVAIEDPAATLRFSKTEADVLQLYFRPLVSAALAHYESTYHVKPPAQVQIEVYPDHEDFAVRTLGLPGLGALGVTFGNVVAMDSPSGRAPGSFNWASTLWHEMNHVFVLTATQHRVPRWFAEGLAVYEQGQAKPEWSEHLTPDVVSALAQKKLLPIDQLDAGFIRPTYPRQIVVSYYQAGRICDFIQERWGRERLVKMVQLFATPLSTAAVVRQALELEPENFDIQFQAWLTRDIGSIVTNLAEWQRRQKNLAQLVKGGQADEALAEGEAARQLFPRYVDAGSPYDSLTPLYLKKGNKTQALAVLVDYQHFGGEDPKLLETLATLQEQAGEPLKAAATLDAINDIYPVNNEELHARLAALWLAQHNSTGAIREYSALVALHPLDRAGALYHLAEAYLAAHETKLAEDTVLAALEAVPGYRPAQQLLLKIEDGDSPQRP